MKKSYLLLLFIFALFFALACIYTPVLKPLPSPTGLYGIGTVSYHLIDEKRQDPYAKQPVAREFMITMWYPADEQKKCVYPYASYQRITENLKWLSSGNQTFSMRVLYAWNVVNHWAFEPCTNSNPNASLSDAKKQYPVIFFVPGYGVSVFMYTALLENLASHGFIVVGINHTYINGTTVFPDGRVIYPLTIADLFKDSTKNGDAIWQGIIDVCQADINYVIAQLHAMATTVHDRWHDRIDFNQCGIVGHSIGGAVAAQAISAIPLLTKGIDIDGWEGVDRTALALSKPFLFMINDTAYPSAEIRKDNIKEIESVCAKDAACKMMIVPGFDHASCTDLALLKWPFHYAVVDSKQNPVDVLQTTNGYVVEFFKAPKHGTIVLLNGTSSAGKSSIVQSLSHMYGDMYEVANGDTFLETYSFTKEQESMPTDILQRQILGDLFLHVNKLAAEGKNVLVDVVEFDDHYDYYCSILDCKNVIKILVYCPPDVLVDRVAERNRLGEEKEKRPLNLSFAQFKNIYKVQESADERVVDRIATSCIKYGLDKAVEEIRQLMKESGQQDIEANIESGVVKPFSEQFNLDTAQEIVLVPKHHWDLVVNTGIQSPQEAAQTIAAFLGRR